MTDKEYEIEEIMRRSGYPHSMRLVLGKLTIRDLIVFRKSLSQFVKQERKDTLNDDD